MFFVAWRYKQLKRDLIASQTRLWLADDIYIEPDSSALPRITTQELSSGIYRWCSSPSISWRKRISDMLSPLTQGLIMVVSLAISAGLETGLWGINIIATSNVFHALFLTRPDKKDGVDLFLQKCGHNTKTNKNSSPASGF
jgi:hypothetical protein